MAVSRMRKLSAVTMREDADGLLYALQRLRCVDLQRADGAEPMEQTALPRIRSAICQAEAAMAFLTGYGVKTRGWTASPAVVEWDEGWPEGEVLAEKAAALSRQMEENRKERGDIRNLREGLLPWREYEGDLPEGRTGYTKTLCGLFLPGTDLTAMEEALGEYACVTEDVGQSVQENAGKDKNRPVAVTVWHEDSDAVMQVLHGFGFMPVPYHVTAAEGGAAGKLSVLTEKEAVLKGEYVRLQKEAEELAAEMHVLEEYLDRLTTMEARTEAAVRLAYTNRTAVLTGWVPEHMAEKTAALLEKRGAAWQFSDPEPEDDVPVLLINNAMASPFEPVVSLYSLPAYGTFDPTFLMSFFYILIFGLMFADVGYGLLLTAGCILGRYLLHTEGTLRKFCNMFFLCGISMTGMGILFGGYFGDLPQTLAQNFGGRQMGDTALWFSPLQDPMGFLVISIAVGAVHLFTGLAVRFWILWRAGDRLSAVSDAGSWMLIFTGAGLCLLHPYAGLTIAGIGAAVLVCTGGRHEKNPVMKVLKGLSGLYGIVNYVSDLLSYSRILSLGLASAVIASVFNIIGTMAGPTFIGVMLLVVVGTIGHGMNLAINLLGSFVHTSRLQYIEFFGKFYADGGRAFTPLEPQSRYVRFR